MKNLLLILAVLAVVVYGFWLMKRLDSFLENVKISEDENHASQ